MKPKRVCPVIKRAVWARPSKSQTATGTCEEKEESSMAFHGEGCGRSTCLSKVISVLGRTQGPHADLIFQMTRGSVKRLQDSSVCS